MFSDCFPVIIYMSSTLSNRHKNLQNLQSFILKLSASSVALNDESIPPPNLSIIDYILERKPNLILLIQPPRMIK